MCSNMIMSSNQHYEEKIPTDENIVEKKVKLTDLVSRMKSEQLKEKKSNIALSVAAVSAVTVFGIILSL